MRQIMTSKDVPRAKRASASKYEETAERRIFVLPENRHFTRVLLFSFHYSGRSLVYVYNNYKFPLVLVSKRRCFSLNTLSLTVFNIT